MRRYASPPDVTHVRAGTKTSWRYVPPEKILEDPAFAETWGNPSCPDVPQKPYLPRKWGSWCTGERMVVAG
jgi:hypothetical protein